MKHLITSLLLLSAFSVIAQTEYMNNDGKSAPETLDRASELDPVEIQREEVEDAVTPTGDAQQMQKEEAEKVEDNFLIGPYNNKGEFTFPNEEEKERRKELQRESFD